jgi:tRNA dimethylallyltransferase
LRSGVKNGGTDALLIAGPTASGKSALALRLAEQHGGVVINADSMQVYRDLRILTARPTPDEEARAPHRLYGHVDGAENYSAGRFCRDAADVLAEARAKGLLPIVVGGTGLYFRALTAGLAAIPPVAPDIRESLRARLAQEGVEALHAELARCDPASAARLMVRDRTRILRALEVFVATGRPLSDWHREEMPAVIDPARALKFFLDVDRDELWRRIDRRFDVMLKEGAIEEVRALDARGLPEHLPVMKAHGVPWLRRYLHGLLGLDEAAEAGKADTRHYAKRQVTWFRNQMPGWLWRKPEQVEGEITAQLR